MKNIMKKIVAFICVLALSVGAMAAWTPAKEVKATETSEPTPVYMEGFKHVTTTNFSMANPFTADMSTRNSYSLKDANGNPVSGNFDKVVFSTNVTWNAGDGGACPKLMLAAVGGTSSNSGFQIYPNKAGTAINIYDNNLHPLTTYQTGSSDVLLGVIYATDVANALGQDTFSFVDNDFMLQTSFEYYDKEVEVEDEVTTQKYLRFVFYIDGTQIRVNERLSSASSTTRVSGLDLPVQNYDTKHGNIIGYKPYANSTGTLLLTPVDISPVYNPVYVNGYKHVTLNDFSMGNVFSADLSTRNSYSLKNNNGTAVSGNLDEVLFSAKVKWNAGTGGACPKLMFAAVGGTSSNSGFQIYPNKTGTAVNITDNYLYPLTTYQTSTTADALLGVIYAADVASALGEASFSFVDNEFILQIGLDYYESTDDASQTCLEMVFYINGEQIQINPRNTASPNSTDRSEALEMVVQNYDTKHGNIIGYKPYATSQGLLEMSSVVAENPDLTPITWSDFELSDQAYLKSGYKDTSLKSDVTHDDGTPITQLGNTSFEGYITFLSDAENDRIYFGGGGRTLGLRFATDSDGSRLKLLLGNNTSHDFGITTTSGNNKVFYFDKTIAGVDSFLNNEFCLKITTEYADYDADGLQDDVQLGIFIDGKLYNNRYWYAIDYTSATNNNETTPLYLAGNQLGIYSNASATDNKGIMLRSVTTGLKDMTYDISESAYTSCGADFSNATIVKLGEIDKTASLNSLSVSGDYTLSNESREVGNLVLYKAGDVHPDSETDVRDLVAMMKVNANKGVDTWAGTMGAFAADFDEETVIVNLLNVE